MLNTYLFVGILLVLFLHIKGAYNIPKSEFADKMSQYSFSITAASLTIVGWLPLIGFLAYKKFLAV
jgi:hypothetical protein